MMMQGGEKHQGKASLEEVVLSATARLRLLDQLLGHTEYYTIALTTQFDSNSINQSPNKTSLCASFFSGRTLTFQTE